MNKQEHFGKNATPISRSFRYTCVKRVKNQRLKAATHGTTRAIGRFRAIRIFRGFLNLHGNVHEAAILRHSSCNRPPFISIPARDTDGIYSYFWTDGILYVRTYVRIYLLTYPPIYLPTHHGKAVVGNAIPRRAEFRLPPDIHIPRSPLPRCSTAPGDRIMPYEKRLVWKCNITETSE